MLNILNSTLLVCAVPIMLRYSTRISVQFRNTAGQESYTQCKMFAGLPELGISNGEDLKETLTNCTEPLKAINQFQVTVISMLIISIWEDWDTCSLDIIVFPHLTCSCI